MSRTLPAFSKNSADSLHTRTRSSKVAPPSLTGFLRHSLSTIQSDISDAWKFLHMSKLESKILIFESTITITNKNYICVHFQKQSRRMDTFMREKVSKKKIRYRKDGFDLDLTCTLRNWLSNSPPTDITDRIVALGFPSVGKEAMYRNPLPQVYK